MGRRVAAPQTVDPGGAGMSAPMSASGGVPGRRVSPEMLRGLLDAATVGAAAAAFAHDANNRLTVLLTGLDLLAAPGSDEQTHAAALRLVTGAAHQLADEVQALLAASHARRTPPERVQIAAAVGHVVDALEALVLAEGPLSFELDVPPGLATEADPGRLELALVHGLRFAYRCGAQGISLRAQALQVPERDPARPWLRRGGYCELRLTMHGASLRDPGLSSETATGDEPPGPEDHAAPEFAAVAAIVQSLRGVARARRLDPATCVLELHLPLMS
jgi:hypothetical protein